MKSSQEKFVKRKIEKLDKVFFQIEDLSKTEAQIFTAISGYMKRSRKLLKEILGEMK